MAGSEDDIGGFKGLQAETQLCSHQDLVDSGGTRFECKGNGNVRDDDLGGSYVFVSGGVGVSSGLDVGENYDVEVKDGVVGNDQDSAVEVEDKEAGLRGEFVAEVVESVTSGEDDFEGKVEDRVEFESGEDLESRTGNSLELGEEEGMAIVLVGDGELLDKSQKDVEKNLVESISELRKSDKSDSNVSEAAGCELPKVEAEINEEESQEQTELKSVVGDLESRTGNGSELGESEGTVILSAADSELLDKSAKDMERNIVVSISEWGESEKPDTIDLRAAECELAKDEASIDEQELQDGTELKSVVGDLESQTRISVNCMSSELEKNQKTTRQMEDLGSDAELVDIQEGLIESEYTGEFDKSLKAVEQDLVVSPTDFGEGYQSNTVALGADTCELEEIQAAIEVDVGEGKSEEQTELNSVEESLKSEIRTTESVDCVSNDLEENWYKFKHMTDLNSEIDGGVPLGDEIDVVADKGIICTAAADNFKVATDKDLDECIDGSQSGDKLDMTPSNAATFCIMDKLPIEHSEDITACTNDYAVLEHEASRSVLVQGIGAANSRDINSDKNQAKIFGSVLASVDDSTVSDQGPVDVDRDVGLVQGYEAVRVANIDGILTTETATRCATDQSKISQINLGEQRSGCTKTPELNGNPDDAHSDCVVPPVQSDEVMRSDSNGATILKPEGRNLICPITDNTSELVTKHLVTEDVESGILCVTDGTKTETEVGNGPTSGSPNDLKSEMKIEFGTVDSTEVVTESWGRNLLSNSEILNGDNECNRKEAILTTSSIESESCADMNFKCDVQNHSAMNHSDMPRTDATVADRSIGDSVDGQSLENVAKAKPFQFLAKFPRIDDDKLQDQIRNAQLLVEEKTVLRNNIGCEIDIKRVCDFIVLWFMI